MNAVSSFDFTANQLKCYVQVLSKTSARNCLKNHLIKTYLFWWKHGELCGFYKPPNLCRGETEKRYLRIISSALQRQCWWLTSPLCLSFGESKKRTFETWARWLKQKPTKQRLLSLRNNVMSEWVDRWSCLNLKEEINFFWRVFKIAIN